MHQPLTEGRGWGNNKITGLQDNKLGLAVALLQVEQLSVYYHTDPSPLKDRVHSENKIK